MQKKSLTNNRKIDPINGNLTAFDIPKDFRVKRVFFINRIPSAGVTRGNHANKKSNQILFCTSGRIDLTVYSGKKGSKMKRVYLFAGDHYIHNRMNWISMDFHSCKSELCVIADHKYDPKEYITDLSEFKKAVRST